MVSKLANTRYFIGEHEVDPSKMQRDEVRLVITDTVILCESEDPHELLDKWMEGE